MEQAQPGECSVSRRFVTVHKFSLTHSIGPPFPAVFIISYFVAVLVSVRAFLCSRSLLETTYAASRRQSWLGQRACVFVLPIYFAAVFMYLLQVDAGMFVCFTYACTDRYP